MAIASLKGMLGTHANKQMIFLAKM